MTLVIPFILGGLCLYRLKELAIEVAERFKRNELNIVADALAFRLILSIFLLFYL